MSQTHFHGSCHCKAVRFEVALDLSKGTHRCNCSLCWKARAWFAIAGGDDHVLTHGAEDLGRYAWVPPGKGRSILAYRFCRRCGVRVYAEGELESLGGRFHAVHIPALDDASRDELAEAPLFFNDMLHDAPDRTPDDVRNL